MFRAKTESDRWQNGVILIGGLIVICLVVLYVYVFQSVSKVVTLPAPTGPYSVGTRAIAMADPNTKAFRGDGQNRWMIQAFYPSQTRGVLPPYMPDTLSQGIIHTTQVTAHSHVNSEIKKGPNYPVLFFVPGLGQERQKYTILCEELASKGYIVLAFDVPYISNYVHFPVSGDSITLTLEDAWKVPRDRDFRYLYFDEAMIHVMKLIEFTLTSLKELSKTHFNQQMDLSKLGIIGHSFGGNVAHTLGVKNPKFSTVVDIDSKITDRKILDRQGPPQNKRDIPVFFIRGMKQYQDNVGSVLTSYTNGSLWAPDVEHNVFSDEYYLAKVIDNFGIHSWINWAFAIGPQWSITDTDSGNIKTDEWIKIYRSKVVSWLQKHLPLKKVSVIDQLFVP